MHCWYWLLCFSFKFNKFFLLSVTYMQSNPGGLTIYGYTVDRALIGTIFFLEFSLALFVLGKTITFTTTWFYEHSLFRQLTTLVMCLRARLAAIDSLLYFRGRNFTGRYSIYFLPRTSFTLVKSIDETHIQSHIVYCVMARCRTSFFFRVNKGSKMWDYFSDEQMWDYD